MDKRLDFLVSNSRTWIRSQRAKYRPLGAALSAHESERLTPWLTNETLAVVRVARVRTIDNPDFYDRLGQMPLDLRRSAGITYDDTILISALAPTPAPISLLFHELVHVVQYAVLGIDRFAERYVRGWAEHGFEYRSIPLEVMAFSMERHFIEGTLASVPMESAIRAALEPC